MSAVSGVLLQPWLVAQRMPVRGSRGVRGGGGSNVELNSPLPDSGGGRSQLDICWGLMTASPTPFRILAVWVALSRVGQFGAPTWALTLLLGFGAVIVPQ